MKYLDEIGLKSLIDNLKTYVDTATPDISIASSTNDGLMSKDDKEKLDSIDINDFNSCIYDAQFSNINGYTLRLIAVNGNDSLNFNIPLVSSEEAGVMSVTDKNKLDSLLPLEEYQWLANETTCGIGIRYNDVEDGQVITKEDIKFELPIVSSTSAGLMSNTQYNKLRAVFNDEDYTIANILATAKGGTILDYINDDGDLAGVSLGAYRLMRGRNIFVSTFKIPYATTDEGGTMSAIDKAGLDNLLIWKDSTYAVFAKLLMVYEEILTSSIGNELKDSVSSAKNVIKEFLDNQDLWE